MRATSVMLAVMLLAGCKLIDQTTFAPSPEAKAQAVEVPKADARTPLVSINFAQPDPDYQGRFAMHCMRRRNAIRPWSTTWWRCYRRTPTSARSRSMGWR